MSARTRRRGGATKRPTCAGMAPTVATPNADRLLRGLPDAQRAWWALALAGGLVAMLGFQTLPPSRRLDAIEAANARQDSVFAIQAAAQRVALDTIRRQLGQLLAGQCAKERDGMARVFYGCGGGR